MANGNDADSLPTSSLASLPTAMAAAAFLGISWYLSIELNVRLILTFTRRSLYVWSCLLCSWGILIHTVSILLANFNVWKDYSAVIVIDISFATFIVAQSFVLYSRLNLVLSKAIIAQYVLCMIVINSVIFGLGTAIFGMVARYPSMVAKLGKPFLTWDKIQLAAFTIQETIISLVYIRETKGALSRMAILTNQQQTRRILHHLIYVNILIICLDISLMGVCYAGFFFLQGYYKAAIYAIKVRMEFTILNQLRSALPSTSYASQHRSTYRATHDSRPGREERPRGSQDSDVEIMEMVTTASSVPSGGARVQKDLQIYSTKREGRVSGEVVWRE